MNQRRELEAGRLPAQLRQSHLVVGLGRVAALGTRPVRLGNPGFEIDDSLRPRRGILFTREREDVRQVLEIFCSRLRELRIARQIIVAIRHAETALRHRENIVVRVFPILRDKATKRRRNAHHFTLRVQLRETGPALQPANLTEPRCKRRQAFRFDGRFIHEARIGIADLAVRVLRLLVDYTAGPLAREVVEHVEHAVARLVGRDGVVLRPGTVGVFVEIVARHDAAVHARRIETEVAVLRPCKAGCRRHLRTGKNRRPRRSHRRLNAQRRERGRGKRNCRNSKHPDLLQQDISIDRQHFSQPIPIDNRPRNACKRPFAQFLRRRRWRQRLSEE